MNKIYIFFIFSFLISTQVSAQGKVTLRDAKEISYQAKATVQSYESLLNYIAFSDNTASELQETLENSYKPNKNRIFYNKGVIVEDDISTKSKPGSTKELPAEKYLNDFDLQYEKGVDNSVVFSNIVVSSVKQLDYIYVNVKYDSKFSNKNKISKTGYEPTQREALVRMEGQGNGQWKAFILGIKFYNPADSIGSAKNNAEVTTDESENATAVSAEDLKREQESFIAAREEERKKQEAIYDEFLELATSALSNKRYKESLEYLEKAKEIKPMVPTLERRIQEAKRLVAENTYENFKNKADLAKSERRFVDAIALYKEAQVLNPAAFAEIDAAIKPIAKKVEELGLPKSKLESQDYQGAIASCEALLKENKKIKNEFPELYYIEGAAYQAMYEKTPENKLKDKALENYNQAITIFPNYIDARVARANFYVKHKNDPVSAIADYDVLTTNLLDLAPNKPKYYAAKAKLKDDVKNMEGAVADYGKAIALSPKTATYYCDLGELQFRLKSHDLALKNLTTAITLDPKFSNAYYHRGMNYIELKDTRLAGLDFMEAEKAGIDAPKVKNIEQKSDEFLKKGQDLLVSGNFADADSAFNKSLEIRNCNSISLFGKAEIRFLTAKKLEEKEAASVFNGKYQEGIDLYKRAILCNPKYSEAYFKKGLSHTRKAEYELAIESFSDAIAADSSNVVAYIEKGNALQITTSFQKASEAYIAAIALLKTNLEATKKNGKKEQLPLINSDISLVSQLNGEALYNIQQYAPAILALEQAMDYNEKNAEALYYMGLVYDAQNELSKATKNFNEGLKYEKKYKYFFANGKVYFKTKNYADAITNFDEGIRLDDGNKVKDKHYLRGLSYLKLKQWDNAVKDFSEYGKVDVSATDAAYFADMGLAQLYLNQDADAGKNFNKAVELKNDHAQALYGLGLVSARASSFDKAYEYLEKAYMTRQIIKDQYAPEEKAFLADFMKVKANKTKFNQLKSSYAIAK
ncbi:tetratricopeptide repeat protein [Pedobacter metabolipauper]|uniref:Tetratricopeptide repeat protein n=1 Tax=Pedobacter metabolipauper TaxID=425513 RepID=A0A4R6SXJ9_9SPHI|nr:tetratricopeptide repeat protein [Pedobacter metabolipauper]TDQ09432.1 tetratricopeptide repeat protein [Pedobacter metabolipauper]